MRTSASTWKPVCGLRQARVPTSRLRRDDKSCAFARHPDNRINPHQHFANAGMLLRSVLQLPLPRTGTLWEDPYKDIPVCCEPHPAALPRDTLRSNRHVRASCRIRLNIAGQVNLPMRRVRHPVFFLRTKSLRYECSRAPNPQSAIWQRVSASDGCALRCPS